VDSALTGAGTAAVTDGIFTLNGSTTVSNMVLAGSSVIAGTNVIADHFEWTGNSLIGPNEYADRGDQRSVVRRAYGGDNEMCGVLTNAGTIQITNGALRLITYFY